MEKYHFDYEDFIKGVCKKKEIGQECSSEELEIRCKKAEKTNPYRYRLAMRPVLNPKSSVVKLLLLIGTVALISLLLAGWILLIINNKMYLNY